MKTKIAPLIQRSPHRWQPVDRYRIWTLLRHNGGQRDGGRLPVCQPLLVDQVQVTVHSGHLVRSEMVGAVVIWCGIQKKKKESIGNGSGLTKGSITWLHWISWITDISWNGVGWQPVKSMESCETAEYKTLDAGARTTFSSYVHLFHCYITWFKRS